MTTPDPSVPPAFPRIVLVDTLRALALFGVIAMNVLAMQMAFVADQVMASAGPADKLAALLDLVLLQGKARSAFAFLFGLGFGVLLARAQARGGDGTGLFLRRMAVLALIGVINALFFFWGDILIMYALLGATLPLFRRVGDRTLAWAGLLLVLVPPLLQGGVEAFIGPWPRPQVDHEADVAAALAAFSSPTFGPGVIAANLHQHLSLWLDDPVQRAVYMTGVFGLFLLGLLTARRGWLFDVAAHRPLLARIAWIALPSGLVLSVLYATIHLGWKPPQPWAGLQKAAYLGLPVMAFGYLAAFALWFQRGGAAVQRALAPLGRMALTGYLASNLMGTLVFHGYGLGRMGELNLVAVNAVAIAIFVALALFAHAWLGRFRQGPAEWLWRRAYGSRALQVA